jgi:hypothetical protein
MKKYYLFALFFISLSGIAQSVNDYKYLVVPLKFDFQDEINQYRLNSSAKFILEKEGFTALFDNDVLPMDLARDKCRALYVDVIKKGNFMATKIQVVFKDCQNNILYTSDEGRSKEKKFEVACKEALINALKSVKTLNYKYNGSDLHPEPAVLQNNIPETKTAPISPVVSDNLLFAQPTANGFQLVDNTPKIVLKLVKTSQPDYFMASADDKQGVVYLKNKEWFFDYYKDEKLISEKLNIKF